MTVYVEEYDGIKVVRISNPPDNLLNSRVLNEILNLVRSSKGGVIIFRGLDNVFSRGLDKHFFKGLDNEGIISRLGYIRRVFNSIRLYKGITYAVLEGDALDEGFELALMTDYIYSKPKVTIGLPKIRRGLLSLGGFTRIIIKGGEKAIYNILVKGGLMYADEAYKYGIIDGISADPYTQALNDAKSLLDIYGKDHLRIFKDYISEKYIHHDTILYNIEEGLTERLFITNDIRRFIGLD